MADPELPPYEPATGPPLYDPFPQVPYTFRCQLDTSTLVGRYPGAFSWEILGEGKLIGADWNG